MVFTDWWWIPALVIIVGFVLSLAIGFGAGNTVLEKVAGTTVLFLIGLAGLNVMTLLGSSSSQGDRSARPAEVSEYFGLVPGQAYPMVIGDRIIGPSGSGWLSSGLFTVRGGFDIQPGSAVSVGFQHEEKSYILELPMSGITFVQDEEAEPSIVVYLEEHSRYYSVTTDVSYTYGPCTFVLQDFLWMCHKETVSVEYSFFDEITRAGLAPVVADNFQSAVITLTPEMYAELLG